MDRAVARSRRQRSGPRGARPCSLGCLGGVPAISPGLDRHVPQIPDAEFSLLPSRNAVRPPTCHNVAIIMNLFSQPVPRVRPIQGIDFSRLQLQLAAIGLAIVGVVWLFLGHLAFKDVFETLFTTLIVGNCTAVSIAMILPVFGGLRFPRSE